MFNTLGTAALRNDTLVDRAICVSKLSQSPCIIGNNLYSQFLISVGLHPFHSASEISVNRSELQRAAILQDWETMLQ